MSDQELESIGICTPRHPPREEWAEAARTAAEERPDNVPEGAKLETPTAEGGRLALEVSKYWRKGEVKLTVGFLDNPKADLRARILLHMNAWSKTANVSFVESATEPRVRIAREGGDKGGYWSWIGTDIKRVHKDKPTMNLEAFTMDTKESEFHRVVRHETGHTLGFPHEHMRLELVKRLDKEKVISDYMRTQGWSRQEVIDQVLTPLEESSILGTPPDVHSIMCYQIDGKLTKDGKAVPGGLDIDASDYAFAARVYPR